MKTLKKPVRAGDKRAQIPVQSGLRAEQYAAGKALRATCPRNAHAVWKAPSDRRDAVELVLEAEKGRLPDLLPLRHGRMVRSAFTFYRGAALTMAADLASTPATGVRVQCCGDAHLCNFGGFRHPGAEGHLLHQRPRRDPPGALGVGRQAPRRELRRGLPGQRPERRRGQGCGHDLRPHLPRVHGRVQPDEDAGAVVPGAGGGRAGGGHQGPRASQAGHEAHGEGTGEERRRGDVPEARGTQGGDARHQGPAPHDLPPRGPSPGRDPARSSWTRSPGTAPRCPTAYQSLLDRYELRDAAIKVVGVGSVGTACWVFLFMAGEGDPLFLQVKEARASVLEPYAGASVFPNHGQRVVNGYRLMQPASDMFLGWSRGPPRSATSSSAS